MTAGDINLEKYMKFGDTFPGKPCRRDPAHVDEEGFTICLKGNRCLACYRANLGLHIKHRIEVLGIEPTDEQTCSEIWFDEEAPTPEPQGASATRTQKRYARGTHAHFDFAIRSLPTHKAGHVDAAYRRLKNSLARGMSVSHTMARATYRTKPKEFVGCGLNVSFNMGVIPMPPNLTDGCFRTAEQIADGLANNQLLSADFLIPHHSGKLFFTFAPLLQRLGNQAYSQPELKKEILRNSIINFEGSISDAKALADVVYEGGDFRDLKCVVAKEVLWTSYDAGLEEISAAVEEIDDQSFVFVHLEGKADPIQLLDFCNQVRPLHGSVVLAHSFADADLEAWFPYSLKKNGLWLSGLCSLDGRHVVRICRCDSRGRASH